MAYKDQQRKAGKYRIEAFPSCGEGAGKGRSFDCGGICALGDSAVFSKDLHLLKLTAPSGTTY